MLLICPDLDPLPAIFHMAKNAQCNAGILPSPSPWFASAKAANVRSYLTRVAVRRRRHVPRPAFIAVALCGCSAVCKSYRCAFLLRAAASCQLQLKVVECASLTSSTNDSFCRCVHSPMQHETLCSRESQNCECIQDSRFHLGKSGPATVDGKKPLTESQAKTSHTKEV